MPAMEEKLDDIGKMSSNGLFELPLSVDMKNETLAVAGGKNQIEVACKEGSEGGLVVGEMLSDGLFELPLGANTKDETPKENTRGENQVEVASEEGSEGGLRAGVSEILSNWVYELVLSDNTKKETTVGENQIEMSSKEGSEGGLMAGVGEMLSNGVSELALVVDMKNETLEEKTGCENQVEVFCKEGSKGDLVADVGEMLSNGGSEFPLSLNMNNNTFEKNIGGENQVEVSRTEGSKDGLMVEVAANMLLELPLSFKKVRESAKKIDHSRRKRRLDEYVVSDLVWGKVRNYPWWPGQIFNPSYASKEAPKHFKKNAHLVAYFADATFAWVNKAHSLKPFIANFSLMENKSYKSELYQSAVNCALEEVSNRVELGLACSCIPKDEYSKIEAQVIKNSGISEKSSLRYGVDWSNRADSLEPEKLIEFLRRLAPRATSWYNRVDVVTSLAQLTAFCRFKGYRYPNESISVGNLLENDADDQEKKYQEEDRAKAKDLTGISVKKRKAFELKVYQSGKRAKFYAGEEPSSIDKTHKRSARISRCPTRLSGYV